jgi:hypothetical protein
LFIIVYYLIVGIAGVGIKDCRNIPRENSKTMASPVDRTALTMATPILFSPNSTDRGCPLNIWPDKTPSRPAVIL